MRTICGNRRVAALLAFVAALYLAGVSASIPYAASQVADPPVKVTTRHPHQLFLTSHECMACHNGLTTPTGEDVSIGVSWRSSIMANSSRDPYWQAGVRREILDHPGAAEEIEDECAICHMPMSRTTARAEKRHGRIFDHLPIALRRSQDDRLAADGVSCTVCHQIGPERLGSGDSFNGGFVLATPSSNGDRRMFGPFQVQSGQQTVMRSATGMTPQEATYVRESEICATCHTLFTQALGPKGEWVGKLPEQVPYLEWRHSAFRLERSCQSCHMPEVKVPTRISSVLGEAREGLGRHTFVGGNFFMLRMLNRYRTELGVEALPRELEATAIATIAQLQRDTATLSVTSRPSAPPGRLEVEVSVRNLTGHKLPTAYPSRRVWLHFAVHDRDGQIVFESGRVDMAGRILGNDNDDDPNRFEPHHDEISSPDQVQVYESIISDVDGRVTTGLLQAVGYLKDNRLLPRGFDKATAPIEIASVGQATQDGDFEAQGDRVKYLVSTEGRTGPFRIDVELRYQPISYRWAQNLRGYDAPETNRFITWYEAMSPGSSELLARAGLLMP
jgi:hypothetical protein